MPAGRARRPAFRFVSAVLMGLVAGTSVATLASHEGELVSIAYEGNLESDGAPLNATARFNFALFPCAQGSPTCSPVWLAVGTWDGNWPDDGPSIANLIDVPVSSGRFAVALGAAPMNLLDEDILLENENLYLAVQVEQVALGGLQPIGRSPYAIRASEAVSLYIAESLTVDGPVALADDVTADGSVTVDGSVMVEGAFVPPRLTTAERDALVAPAAGSVIFNTTEGDLNTFDGTDWNPRWEYVMLYDMYEIAPTEDPAIPHFESRAPGDTTGYLVEVTSDTVHGAQIKALRDCTVTAHFSHIYNTGSQVGFSLDASEEQRGLPFYAISPPVAHGRDGYEHSQWGQVSVTVRLQAGQVLRPHDEGGTRHNQMDLAQLIVTAQP